MAATPHERSAVIKVMAREEGFDLVGIAPAEISAHGEAYRAWIAAGKHGEMTYLARHVEERLDMRKRWPWARSVVCLGISYWTGQPPGGDSGNRGEYGRISRYAWGRDYHRVLGKKLQRLEARLRAAHAQDSWGGERLEVRGYSDSGPVLERELAARAGLGWIGKHTLLIHPRHGSWFFLGELVVSLDLESDAPIDDHCGTCTRCIEACPTRAISPYSVDATRCISYLTLEHRGLIDKRLMPALGQGGYLIGCDICQEVCPFNREGPARPLATREPDFAARPPAPAVGLRQVLAWQEQEWDILTRGRASRRAKSAMWKRNAEILMSSQDAVLQ